MTKWDLIIFKEAGILAVLIFSASIAAVYFGGSVEYFGDGVGAFWRFVGWLVGLTGVVRIGWYSLR